MSRFFIRPVGSGVKFDLKAPNGQTILTSEVYETEAACRRGIASICKNAPAAPVEDQTDPDFQPLSNPKFQLYRDKAGAFRFRLKARNGRIIGISEAYESRANCLGGIESVKENAADV